MFRSAVARASSIISAARSVWPRSIASRAAVSIMSRLTSSWTGPSWIDSATRRRISLSVSIMCRDTWRARRRPVVSARRMFPAVSAVASAVTTKIDS